MDIQQAINEFVLYCQVDRQLSKNTVKAYRQDLGLLRKSLSGAAQSDVAVIERGMLRGFLREYHGQKPRTLKRKLASVRSFFKYLTCEKVIIEDPSETLEQKIKLPKALPRTLPAGEPKRILRKAHRRLKENSSESIRCHLELCVLELLYGTGVRVSELSALDVGDVDLYYGSLRISGKGGKERIVPVFEGGAKEALREYLSFRSKGQGALLLNRGGGRLSDQSIRSIVKKYSPNATPHMFRHTLATQLLSNGADIRFIQKLLGHSSIVTTAMYAHVEQKAQRRIIRSKHPRMGLVL